MNIRLLARRALKSSPIALLAILAFGGSAAASSPNNIEGVWSFEHGAVAIQPLPDGTFQGTVVSPTTFAKCVHPEGQVMWTEMQQQADGSFSGRHLWYHGTSCEEEKVRGRTAWRVLTSSSGERTLKVCLNKPGEEVQPTIGPNGAPFSETEYPTYSVTYGCVASNPLAPLPATTGAGGVLFSKTVVLPKGCVSQTSLKIALKNPKYDPLKEVVVRLNGKKVADVKGVKRLKKGITLKKLPSGTYKISVTATTVLNQRLTGSQTYKSCTKGSGKIKLKKVKVHHS